MPSQPQTLLLVRHQQAVARLYGVLTDQLPRTADIWRRLQAESLCQASRLNALANDIEAGREELDAGHVGAALQKSTASIEAQTKLWFITGVTPRAALQYAWGMENSFLEQRLFATRDGDSVLVRQLLDSLQQNTRNHMARLAHAADRAAHGWLREIMARIAG